MTWLKQNPEKVFLIVAAALLLASAVGESYLAYTYRDVFASLSEGTKHDNTRPALAFEDIQTATKRLENPPVWNAPREGAYFFVSERYFIKDGKLQSVERGEPMHPPVRNTWLLENGLDITDPKVLSRDPDQDGFTNLDEYIAGTDPSDPLSHPAYTTKLRLLQFISIRFRIKFNAYDGDIKQPRAIVFQVDTPDLRHPSQFLKLGDAVDGTKFVLEKFEFKQRKGNLNDEDVSELTLYHTEDKQRLVVTLSQASNYPKYYAKFKYLWNGSEIEVPRGAGFALKTAGNGAENYKLIDINEKEALIEGSRGEKLKIPHL